MAGVGGSKPSGRPSGRLSGRLAAIRSQKTREVPPSVSGKKNQPAPEAPSGWLEAAPLVYKKETVYPCRSDWNLDTNFLISACTKNGSPADREQFLFYDLETTGLSGGAGNPAFLAGTGFFTKNEFHLIQLFLADFPGEPEFLDILGSLMDPEKLWVSYNGRAFDTSLLRSRYLLNRRIFREGRQLDLLYPSRRLWKSILSDCALGTLEKEILGKTREEDVPGAQIPGLYFRYLQTGKPEILGPVFTHHAEDILSLADVYFQIEGVLSGQRFCSFDSAGAGSLLLGEKEEQAVKILKTGFEQGHSRAGWLLGLYWKRRGDWKMAEVCWRRLWNDYKFSPAGLELAKMYEHRIRDYGRALLLVADLMNCSDSFLEKQPGAHNDDDISFFKSRFYGELVTRKARLETKLGKTGYPNQDTVKAD